MRGGRTKETRPRSIKNSIRSTWSRGSPRIQDQEEQAKKESESDEEYELVLATEVDYFRLFPIQPISV